MKTIKSFTYKNYKVSILAEYKEAEWDNGFGLDDGLDIVTLETYINKETSFVIGHGQPHKVQIVEAQKGNHKKLHKNLLEAIHFTEKESRNYVDKLVREKEITDGLPDSLLNSEEVEKEDVEDKINILEDVISISLGTIESMEKYFRGYQYQADEQKRKKLSEYLSSNFLRDLEKLGKSHG